jgi:hypothetical protein
MRRKQLYSPLNFGAVFVEKAATPAAKSSV